MSFDLFDFDSFCLRQPLFFPNFSQTFLCRIFFEGSCCVQYGYFLPALEGTGLFSGAGHHPSVLAAAVFLKDIKRIVLGQFTAGFEHFGKGGKRGGELDDDEGAYNPSNTEVRASALQEGQACYMQCGQNYWRRNCRGKYDGKKFGKFLILKKCMEETNIFSVKQVLVFFFPAAMKIFWEKKPTRNPKNGKKNGLSVFYGAILLQSKSKPPKSTTFHNPVCL